MKQANNHSSHKSRAFVRYCNSEFLRLFDIAINGCNARANVNRILGSNFGVRARVIKEAAVSNKLMFVFSLMKSA